MNSSKTRMAGAELQARRERLGLTLERLADTLGCTEGTVRHWEKGRDPIPYRVPGEVAELEGVTDEAQLHVVAGLREVAYMEASAELVARVVTDHWQDRIVALGERWWRHLVIDAEREIVAGLSAGVVDPSPFLAFPAMWERWGMDTQPG